MKTAEMDISELRRGHREMMEYESESEPSGLFSSIQRTLGTLLAVFESRVELITVEFKELKGRVFALIFWGIALTFLAFMIVVAIMATLVFLLWGQALAVFAGFSVFFLVIAVGSFLIARNKLKKSSFEETISQLRKDRELVTSERGEDFR